VSEAARIAAAFTAACRDELDAPKPGNVHAWRASRELTVAAFVRSAEAAAGPIAEEGARVGHRIAGAIEATLGAVATNTNLGIVLLCAPLAAAAETMTADLRAALARVLDDLDRDDAALAFRAIVQASPAGLGRAARHDVFAPASATLREAMAEAANRDRIARQYVTVFDDVFSLGLPTFAAALPRYGERSWATLAVYLAFLAAFSDSHIVRKHGTRPAEEVRHTAATFHARLSAADDPETLLDDLLAWDAVLKERNINPGTSADLTVATLFAHRLTNVLPSGRNNG